MNNAYHARDQPWLFCFHYNGPPVKTNPEKIIVNQIIPY